MYCRAHLHRLLLHHFRDPAAESLSEQRRSPTPLHLDPNDVDHISGLPSPTATATSLTLHTTFTACRTCLDTILQATMCHFNTTILIPTHRTTPTHAMLPHRQEWSQMHLMELLECQNTLFSMESPARLCSTQSRICSRRTATCTMTCLDHCARHRVAMPE